MPVSSWAYWYEEMNDPAPLDLQFIDPGLRRKLSSLAKHALSLAHQCASGHLNCHIVYASRNGDIARTTQQLLSIMQGESPSPTSFSMSVLNATVGAYSIATSNHAPNTAIAATASSLGFGLMETHIHLLNHPTTPVLFIYADEPPPVLYQADNPDMPAHAIAMLFSSASENRLECRITPSIGYESQQVQSMAMIDCLLNGRASWQGESRHWEWQLYAVQD